MSNKYDVVIIGAGIGGLVCGCYLAKAGMKVLIVEKNSNVGGCCISFQRNNFQFDAAVFSLGGCSKHGNIGRIVTDHNLSEYVNIKRPKVTDIVISPFSRIRIYKDIKNTIDNISSEFPPERKNIEKFFNHIIKTSVASLYSEVKHITFSELLNSYFRTAELKNILGLFMGSAGLPANVIPAYIAILVYKEYILDGGYYPKGGINNFSNALAKRFIKYGGDLMLSEEVTLLKIKGGFFNEIYTNKEKVIKSQVIVANCSPHHLFFKLLKKQSISQKFLNRLKNCKISMSSFLVYLGLKNKSNFFDKDIGKIWYFNAKNIDKFLSNLRNGDIDNIEKGLLFFSPSSKDNTLAPNNMENVCIMAMAPYKNNHFWDLNREKVQDKIVTEMERILPGIRENISVIFNATPVTIEKYTGNTKGAAYGWESTPRNSLSQLTPVSNLFLASHWTSYGSGTPRVSLCGRIVAEHILKGNEKIK